VVLIVERLFVERLYDVYQHPPTLSRDTIEQMFDLALRHP